MGSEKRKKWWPFDIVIDIVIVIERSEGTGRVKAASCLDKI